MRQAMANCLPGLGQLKSCRLSTLNFEDETLARSTALSGGSLPKRSSMLAGTGMGWRNGWGGKALASAMSTVHVPAGGIYGHLCWAKFAELHQHSALVPSWLVLKIKRGEAWSTGKTHCLFQVCIYVYTLYSIHMYVCIYIYTGFRHWHVRFPYCTYSHNEPYDF